MGWEKDKDKQPYMGMVGLYRVSGKVSLFDSETTHQNFIALRIRQASRRRGLSSDWIYGEEDLIEVYMSEAQFASMITSLNMGDGVPCTLHWIKGGAHIQPPGKPDDQTDLFHDEMLEKLVKALDALKALKEQPGISKKRQHEIDQIIQELDNNTGFVANQFAEYMEHRVSKAKTEVEAYMNAFIHRAGMKALGAPDDPDHKYLEDDRAPADYKKDDDGGTTTERED